MTNWLRNHFSLTAWRPYPGEFWLIRADADWCALGGMGWCGVTLALLGFTACLTYWPGGKPSQGSAWGEVIGAAIGGYTDAVPVESLGREHA